MSVPMTFGDIQPGFQGHETFQVVIETVIVYLFRVRVNLRLILTLSLTLSLTLTLTLTLKSDYTTLLLIS